MENAINTEEMPTCKICGTVLGEFEYYVCYVCINREWVKSATYKPAPRFHPEGRPYERRAFGVEIEVHPKLSEMDAAVSPSVAHKIAAALTAEAFGDFAYLKYDGSLDTGGFEIVTHPATYRYLKMNRVFDVLDKLPLCSFSHGDTGLHIHVSRKLMKPLQLCKLVCFFSDDGNSEYLKKVAQRNYNRYCQKVKKENMKHMVSATETNGRATHSERYQAINLVNESTVEFRMFKGNVKPEAIYRAIEFVDAIIEFTARQPSTKLSHEDFIQFIEGKKRRWNLLATWNKSWKNAKLFDEVLDARRNRRNR